MLLPVALLTIFPIAHALWTSLHQVMLLFPGEDFVGLDNYRRVVTGEYFGVALKNSLLFTLFAAPAIVVLGTAVALFLQRDFLGVAGRALDRAAALGAARRDQRRAVDLGVPSELGRHQRPAARSRT